MQTLFHCGYRHLNSNLFFTLKVALSNFGSPYCIELQRIAIFYEIMKPSAIVYFDDVFWLIYLIYLSINKQYIFRGILITLWESVAPHFLEMDFLE